MFSHTADWLKTVGNGGKVQNANGYDIVFTSEGGSIQLDHEIETYNASTGEFVAWVRIPILKYDSDTIIQLTYGDVSITTSQENADGVWGTDHKGVYHMSGNVSDATQYENNGTDQGTSDAAGQISRGRSFSDDYIEIDSAGDHVDTAEGTITAWLTIDTTSDDQYLWQFYTDASNEIYIRYINSTGTIRAGRIAGGTDKYVETTSISEGSSTPRRLTMTWSESADELKVYLDGSQIGTTQTSIGTYSGSTSWVAKASQPGAETIIHSLVELNGKIYGGSASSGKLYEWNGTNAWVEKAGQYGSETYIYAMVVLNGKIYGGTDGTGLLLEWNGADAWVKVADQLNSQTRIRSLVVYNDEIYGGTFPDGNLFKWNGSDAWTQVAPKLGSEINILSLAVYNNKIYGGTQGSGLLYEWNGTNAWVAKTSQLGLEDYILSLAVYNNKLYGSTGYGTGLLYEWNDSNAWVKVADQLNAQTNIHALKVFNGRLYGSTGQGGRLFAWNDSNAWVQVSPQLAETQIFSLETFNNKLYGGTANDALLYEWMGVVNDSANIGAKYDESSTWEGDVDEARVLNTPISAALDTTEYNNQKTPTSFYTVSSDLGLSSTTTTSQTTTSSTASSTSSTASTLSTTSSTASTSSTTSSSISSSSSTSSTASTLSTTSSSTTTSSTVSSSSTTTTLTTTSSSSSCSTTTTLFVCEYNDDLDDFGNLNLTKYNGNESYEIDSGKVKFTLPNDTDAEVSGWYRYEVPAGDFEISVEISDYSKQHSTWGPFTMLEISDSISTRPETDGSVSDWAASIYLQDGALHYTKARYKDNGAYTNGASNNRASAPTKLRLRRVNTTVYFDYYMAGSWYNDSSYDFTTRASNLTVLGIGFADRENKGGIVKFDNIVFDSDGCPTGDDVAWTSTSTTTTTSTLSSTSSSTSSTASTLSTTSSTSSTASTISTTSSTASTISTTTSSSTSSTASTLSTTHTSTTSTCTTTSTPPA